MTNDRLREAARVLRELTEEATPGPWTMSGPYVSGAVYIGNDEVGEEVAAFNEPWESGNVDFIATMHPGVALALADWLEHQSGYRRGEHVWSTDHALRVADLILATEEPAA